MWPLLLCSVTALGIILERFIFWARLNKQKDDASLERIFSEVENGNYHDAIEIAHSSGDHVARIFFHGLKHIKYGLSETMEIRANEEIDRMKAGMLLLDTIITISPLLGILGTVTGIIRAFELLGAGGMQDPKAVSIGIAEALITTAAGLCIALPAIVFFNYFSGKVQRETGRVEKLLTRFEIITSKSVIKKDGT